MNVRFSGIIHYTGSKDKINTEIDTVDKKMPFPLGGDNGSEGIALYGTDAEKFLKEQYNIDVPQELTNKTGPEILATVLENPDKYGHFTNQMIRAAYNTIAFINNMFNYYKTAKNNGKDTDGNPIEEKPLS